MTRPTIRFFYRNHRGELAERTVTVDSVEYVREPGYGYPPGWFVSGHCHDKGARRSFAFSSIQQPEKAKFFKLIQF